MSLESELTRFSKTKKYQQLVNVAKKEAVKSGKPFGQPDGGQFSLTEAMKYAEKMQEILQDVMLTDPNVDFSEIARHIIIGTPEPTANGDYAINVGFDRDYMHRDSLNPTKYDGINNIALLLSKGYNAGGVVDRSSDSNSKFAHSRISRPSNDYMKRAVDMFNAAMAGSGMIVKATREDGEFDY